MSLISTLKDVFTVSHCLNARLCVSYNLARVERAKADLAAAFDALDRCEARARIRHHVEPAPPLPESLLIASNLEPRIGTRERMEYDEQRNRAAREARSHRELSPEALAEFNREIKAAQEHWRRTGRYPECD